MKPGLESGASSNCRYLTICFQLLFMLAVCIGCEKGKTELVGVTFNAETTPMVHSEDVTTLVSDSGITRYRIQAKIWDMYSKATEPYWYFPEKIYVERYDTLFEVEGSIAADTAYFFSNKKLWKLINNVKVLNLQGETFETSELFWDQNIAQIYTDKAVRVTQKDRVISGIGFRSNQEMTDYVFFRASVEMLVNEGAEEPSDTTMVQQSDTIKSKP